MPKKGWSSVTSFSESPNYYHTYTKTNTHITNIRKNMKSLPPLQEQTDHTCWDKVVETLDIDQNDSAKLKENIY